MAQAHLPPVRTSAAAPDAGCSDDVLQALWLRGQGVNSDKATLVAHLRDWADRLDKALPFYDDPEFAEEATEEMRLLREAADALATTSDFDVDSLRVDLAAAERQLDGALDALDIDPEDVIEGVPAMRLMAARFHIRCCRRVIEPEITA